MSPSLRIAWLVLAIGCGGRSYELAEAPADEDDSSSGGTTSGSSGGTTSGSSGDTSSGNASGAAGTAGDMPGSGGASGASSAGGASGGGGTAGSGTNETGGVAGTGADPNCYPGLAESGESCTMPCSLPCGFADMGTRECDCVGGYYLGCGCPRPPEYLGDRTAPTCPTPDGRALPLRGSPCEVEWQQCIGTDPVDSSIPRGCSCLANELNDGELMWFCGSTNRWFFPE